VWVQQRVENTTVKKKQQRKFTLRDSPSPQIVVIARQGHFSVGVLDFRKIFVGFLWDLVGTFLTGGISCEG
jgi:aminoglycoside/choline kinase family phosphotransferase